MTHLGKRIVAGALIAAGGAFVWALISFTYWFFQRHNPGETIFHVVVYAGYAVLVASWFVLPMGGVPGALMLRVVRGCSPRTAFLRGALLGIGAAVIAAIFTIVFTYEWAVPSGRATIVDREAWERGVRNRLIGYLTSMIPVCAIWVGVWAYRWSKRDWPKKPDAVNPAITSQLHSEYQWRGVTDPER